MPVRPDINITLRDIAQATGYSTSTVGYVLRGKGESRHISSAAQAKIQQAAERLGYRGNLFAKALKTGRSGIVAVLGSTNQVSWREHLQFLIARSVQQLGLHAMMFDIFHGGKSSVDLLQQLAELKPDGIIISRIEPEIIPLLHTLQQKGCVIVVFDEEVNAPFDQVALDRFACGYAPTRALLERGHRHIAYTVWGLQEEAAAILQRIAGFRQALEEAGEAFHQEYLLPISSTSNSHNSNPEGGKLAQRGCRLIHTFQERIRARKITALATFDDLLAFGAIRGAHETNLQLPEALSIAGGGFVENVEYLIPSLSTLLFPYEDFVHTVVDLFSSRLSGNHGSPEKIYMKPSFIARESISAG